MKIDPTDKLQPAPKPSSVDPKKNSGAEKFASVFEQKVAGPHHSMQGIMSPTSPSTLMPKIEGIRNETIFHEKTASVLLDSLENYQKLLADHKVSLRDLAPTVEKMKKQSCDACKIMESIAENEPMRGILKETIFVISAEVERFDAGVYVKD